MSILSRRNFLKVTGTAAVATVISTSHIAHAAAPYGNLRMGIQSYSLRHFSFDEAIKMVSELGLNHIEIFSGHLSHNISPAELKEAQKKLGDLGIHCDAYGVENFTKDEAAARKIFEFGKAMDTISLSANPSLDCFDMLDKLVEEYQIPIAIHNHGPNDKNWGRPEQIYAAVKDHHPLIGSCADTGHFLRAGVDPVKAVKLLKGRVFGLHMKDFVSEHEEKVVGDGKLDLKALIKELNKQGFNGTCSIEYELDPEDPIAGIQKGLDNIKAAVKQQGFLYDKLLPVRKVR